MKMFASTKILEVAFATLHSAHKQVLLLHTPWGWGIPEGRLFGFDSAQVSCYSWGCGYTVKDSPLGETKRI